MPQTLGTATSDEEDLILHRASDLLDALPWQRVRNSHTPRCEWMVGQPEAIGAPPGKKSRQVGEKSLFHSLTRILANKRRKLVQTPVGVEKVRLQKVFSVASRPLLSFYFLPFG
jgi:hypothetical protein